jgi:hypothetical protein
LWDLSVDHLQKRVYTSFVGMQVRTSLESSSSKREERVAKERELVQGVLQLAPTISWETEH